MMYLLALALSSALGILLLRLIMGGRFPLYLGACLGISLGLGFSTQIIFYLQILGGNFNHFLPPLVALLLLGILIFLNRSIKERLEPLSKNLSLLILIPLGLALWLEANYYPLGGWDAWSCWNLKAKFLYLGQEHWKDMLAPNMWRSNTNYPLALPSINVFFWHFTGVAQSVPMCNAVLISLLTAAVLLLGLQQLGVSQGISALLTLSVFTLHLGNTLCISQYSDILFSLYLLCTFVCYFLFEKNKETRWLLLTGVFVGLLSFTKNEGLLACAILIGLFFSQRPAKAWIFWGAFLLAALPELIFICFIVPPGQAFVNGLISVDKPSTLERLSHVLTNPVIELIGLQWSGLWILAGIGLFNSPDKAFKKPLVLIGLFTVLYLGVLLAYYQINTFFEIDWWMKNTLNRIIFALLPVVFLWWGLSFFSTLKKDA